MLDVAENETDDSAAEAARVAGFNKQDHGYGVGEELYRSATPVRAAFTVGCIAAWIGGIAAQNAFGPLYFIFMPVVPIVSTIVLAVAIVLSYINIMARSYVALSSGVMTFSIVFLLMFWFGLWGALAALPPYYILVDNDLL